MAASNKCVIVLAPNGRRQNVKVTPNTTILQILEEVCKKQGFKAEEYDIKHHSHMLDTTGLMRFSGLPNNAQLEMAPARKTREESSVFLGLQLESGTRLTGDFLPTDSLWDVIKRLCPDEADPDSNPVVIYMRREVHGSLDLESTTLRSLGLTGGRAMIRYVHRTPEQLHTQANVYHLQQVPSVPIITQKRTKPSTDAPPETPSTSALETPSTSALETPSPRALEEKTLPTPMQVDDAPVEPVLAPPAIVKEESYESLEDMPEPQLPDNAMKQLPERRLEEEIILLGERNALVFSLAMAQSVPYEDLPEDFYDLTLEDARALYRDVRKRTVELEEAPLVTAALRRDLEESTRILSQMSSYKRAVLRVQFPDRTVLQGTFLPLETLGTVIEFVRGYLQDPRISFHLFTTPPKCILAPDVRLVEAGCVPSALLHFGLDHPDKLASTFLREEFLTRLTSPSGAALEACKSRGLVPSSRPGSAPPRPPHETSAPSTSTAAIAGPSRPSTASRPQTFRQDSGPATKMPKWFKPLGK